MDQRLLAIVADLEPGQDSELFVYFVYNGYNGMMVILVDPVLR